MVRDRFIGALAAYHVEPDHFTAAHLRVLDRVSAQAAKVVQDALVFEQIRSDSLTDSLTGLANSRAFIAHAEREMAKADRQDTQRALLVIDVDRFKAINDRYGHDVGDQALRAIGTAIRQAVRSYDFCARNGGDEFVVFLTECDEHRSASAPREIQAAVEALALEATSGVEIRLGISVGWATYPRDGHSLRSAGQEGGSADVPEQVGAKVSPHAAAGPQPDRPLGAAVASGAHLSSTIGPSCGKASTSSCRSRWSARPRSSWWSRSRSASS